MTAEEIKPHLGKFVSLTIPLHRRTNLSIAGDLYECTNPQTQEPMFTVSDGHASAIFPANDVDLIEVSELLGTVIRLTN